MAGTFGNSGNFPIITVDTKGRITGVTTSASGSTYTGTAPIAVTGTAISVATGSSSSSVCIGNDTRLSDSRTPTGSAGGDLTGTYPNPTIKSGVALGGSPTTTTQTAGDNSTKIATTAFVQSSLPLVDPRTFEARLTLTTATPVTVSDATGATTLYLTPYNGNRISLYTSGVWTSYTLSEISQTISGFVSTASTQTCTLTNGNPAITGLSSTTNLYPGMPISCANITGTPIISSVTNSTSIVTTGSSTITAGSSISISFYTPQYDVFLYSASGTLTLQFVAWTNNTTRATALTTQDGVLVQSGDASKRYVGTVRLTGPAAVDDTIVKRFVYNYNNRVRKQLRRFETASSWTNSSATFRQANANAFNQVEVVQGWPESLLNLDCQSEVEITAGTGVAAYNIGIGEDSITARSSEQMGGNTVCTPYGILASTINKTPTVGWHYYAWLESAASSVACTIFPSGGLSGSWDC